MSPIAFITADSIGIVMQAVTVGIFYKHKSEDFKDPIFILGSAYAMSDIWGLSTDIADWGIRVTPGTKGDFLQGNESFWFTKGLGMLNHAFSWKPSIFLQAAIAGYRSIAITCPIYYFKNKQLPHWKTKVVLLATGAYGFAIICCVPLATNKVSYSYYEEYQFVGPWSTWYTDFDFWVDTIGMGLTAGIYVGLGVYFFRIRFGTKEQNNAGSQSVKDQATMLILFFISWVFTALMVLVGRLQYTGGLSFEAWFAISTVVYWLNLSITPILHFLMNRRFRKALVCGRGDSVHPSTSSLAQSKSSNTLGTRNA